MKGEIVMKRLILIAMTVAVGLALTACGEHTHKNTSKETPSSSVSNSPPPSLE